MYIYICIDCFFIINYIYIFSHWHKLIYTLWMTLPFCWGSSNLHCLTRCPISRSSIVPAWSIWKAPGTSWDIYFNQTPLEVSFQPSERCGVFRCSGVPRPFVLVVSEGFFVVHLCLPCFSSKMKLIWHMYSINIHIYIYLNVYSNANYFGTSIQLRWIIHIRNI